MAYKRILITGGSGFIGTNLVEYYLEQGYEVLNIDIASPRNTDHRPYWKNVDILDLKNLTEVVCDFKGDILLHFAARTDLDERAGLNGYSANIDGVNNVIKAIKKSTSLLRIIFASSQLVCSIGYQPRFDTDYCPSTIYGESKALGEKAVINTTGLNVCWTIVRPTSIWGPWFGVPYKNFFISVTRGLYIHPSGIKPCKQWGFVGNTIYQVDQLCKSSSEKINRKIFYLADYDPIDLLSFANSIKTILGKGPVKTIPKNWLLLISRLGDVFQKLGWSNPPLTSFRYQNIVSNEIQNLLPLKNLASQLPYSTEQGIRKTLQWLKDQKLIK
jgi:nucleoside-diphosphate-sugar epimerase